jgi:hypothetical protein
MSHRNPRNANQWRPLAFLAILLATASALGKEDDPLARRASWQAPEASGVRDQVLGWLATLDKPADALERARSAWQDAPNPTPAQNVGRLVESLRAFDPRVEELVIRCGGPWRPDMEPLVDVLADESLPTWVRGNLRLYYGQWLANEQLYRELQEVLGSVTVGDVFDPAALLFFQGVAQHRQLKRDECLGTLAKLLENETTVPTRYAKVAKLMQADMLPLKPDSLDEISRMMDSIQVTLGHGRAGKLVRTEEEDVIKKLDKLIEKLEEQANSSSSQSSSSSGNPGSGPSQPMQDSMPAEQKGPGNVNPKDLGSNTDWGNLPPKEREEALQQLGRDLPSHYRDVIEEYFRKLAREKEE